MAPRILVVDDTQAIRRSLRLHIETETDWEICGEAENGRDAIERVKELQPDLVLLDLSMPVMNGLDAARRIKAIAPGIHILMFTLHTYPQLWMRPGRWALPMWSPSQMRLVLTFCALCVPCWRPRRYLFPL